MLKSSQPTIGFLHIEQRFFADVFQRIRRCVRAERPSQVTFFEHAVEHVAQDLLAGSTLTSAVRTFANRCEVVTEDVLFFTNGFSSMEQLLYLVDTEPRIRSGGWPARI